MASSSFDFDRALVYVLSGIKQEGLSLKNQQVEAVKLLSEGKDVFVWFPTGYGKSICYQLLPFVFDVNLGRTRVLAKNRPGEEAKHSGTILTQRCSLPLLWYELNSCLVVHIPTGYTYKQGNTKRTMRVTIIAFLSIVKSD